MLTSTKSEDYTKEGSLREVATIVLSTCIKFAKSIECRATLGPVELKSAPNNAEEESLKAPPRGHGATVNKRWRLCRALRLIGRAVKVRVGPAAGSATTPPV